MGDSISAVIVTFNEERNIGRAIESVMEVADEIIVLDSFSTDRTKQFVLIWSKIHTKRMGRICRFKKLCK